MDPHKPMLELLENLSKYKEPLHARVELKDIQLSASGDIAPTISSSSNPESNALYHDQIPIILQVAN